MRSDQRWHQQLVDVLQGLIGGTVEALANATHASDHPFVALGSVLALIDAHQRTGAPIIIPVYEGRRGHPALFARETWRELVTVADGGARTVVHAYGARVHEVGVGDPAVLRHPR